MYYRDVEGKIGVAGLQEHAVGLDAEDVGESNKKLRGKGVEIKVSEMFVCVVYE